MLTSIASSREHRGARSPTPSSCSAGRLLVRGGGAKLTCMIVLQLSAGLLVIRAEITPKDLCTGGMKLHFIVYDAWRGILFIGGGSPSTYDANLVTGIKLIQSNDRGDCSSLRQELKATHGIGTLRDGFFLYVNTKDVHLTPYNTPELLL